MNEQTTGARTGPRTDRNQPAGSIPETGRRRMAIGLGLLLGVGAAVGEPLKPFPDHWGEPPAIQTHDFIEWPGGYGHGSSTVAHWIRSNMVADAAAEPSEPTLLYTNDFSTAALGSLPDDMMILNGDFAVREADGERYMELPGTPLDSFVVMFGPAGTDNMEAAARVWGTSRGRRYPSFTLGLNGLGGYRLNLSPAKRQLELFKGPEAGGEALASTPFPWKSGRWVHLKLQVRRTDDARWLVRGKAWLHATAEPAAWDVSAIEAEEPLPGRPFVGASPYSGTPIRFDGLSVGKPSNPAP